MLTKDTGEIYKAVFCRIRELAHLVSILYSGGSQQVTLSHPLPLETLKLELLGMEPGNFWKPCRLLATELWALPYLLGQNHFATCISQLGLGHLLERWTSARYHHQVTGSGESRLKQNRKAARRSHIPLWQEADGRLSGWKECKHRMRLPTRVMWPLLWMHSLTLTHTHGEPPVLGNANALLRLVRAKSEQVLPSSWSATRKTSTTHRCSGQQRQLRAQLSEAQFCRLAEMEITKKGKCLMVTRKSLGTQTMVSHLSTGGAGD